MHFMRLFTLRGKNSVNSPLCVLANSEKPSGCGTCVEFISLAVTEPSSCPAGRGWRGPGGLQGLHAPTRQSLVRCPGGSMTGVPALL